MWFLETLIDFCLTVSSPDSLRWPQLQVRVQLLVALQAEHPRWRVEEEGQPLRRGWVFQYFLWFLWCILSDTSCHRKLCDLPLNSTEDIFYNRISSNVTLYSCSHAEFFRWWLRLPWGQDQRTVEEDDLIYRLLYFVRNHTWFPKLFQQFSSRMECEWSHSFRSVKSYRVKSLHHGKGKDPHQHCRHWPRRLWQVHYHRSLDLQGIIGCTSWAGMQPSWWQNSAYYMITFD